MIIELAAMSLCSSSNRPFFCAVAKIPTPNGLVRKDTPDSALSLRFKLEITTDPVTASPKIGSGLSIL
jgi:hypothetical protein